MSAKKRVNRLMTWLMLLLGFACAAVLGAVFYGTMVYQFPAEQPHASGRPPVQETPAPIVEGADASALFPGAHLTLPGAVVMQTLAEDVRVGGAVCRVVTTLCTMDGMQVRLVSAAPADYAAYLAREGYVPQPVTGYQLGGLDAVYETKGEEGLLAARDGDNLYLLIAPADGQQLYALGAACTLVP